MLIGTEISEQSVANNKLLFSKIRNDFNELDRIISFHARKISGFTSDLQGDLGLFGVETKLFGRDPNLSPILSNYSFFVFFGSDDDACSISSLPDNKVHKLVSVYRSKFENEVGKLESVLDDSFELLDMAFNLSVVYAFSDERPKKIGSFFYPYLGAAHLFQNDYVRNSMSSSVTNPPILQRHMVQDGKPNMLFSDYENLTSNAYVVLPINPRLKGSECAKYTAAVLMPDKDELELLKDAYECEYNKEFFGKVDEECLLCGCSTYCPSYVYVSHGTLNTKQ